jgi:hypothetical protein
MSSSGTRLTTEFRYLLDMINIVFGSGGSAPRPLAPGHGVGVKARRLLSPLAVVLDRLAGSREAGWRVLRSSVNDRRRWPTGTRIETGVSVRTTGKQSLHSPMPLLTVLLASRVSALWQTLSADVTRLIAPPTRSSELGCGERHADGRATACRDSEAGATRFEPLKQRRVGVEEHYALWTEVVC